MIQEIWFNKAGKWNSRDRLTWPMKVVNVATRLAEFEENCFLEYQSSSIQNQKCHEARWWIKICAICARKDLHNFDLLAEREKPKNLLQDLQLTFLALIRPSNLDLFHQLTDYNISLLENRGPNQDVWINRIKIYSTTSLTTISMLEKQGLKSRRPNWQKSLLNYLNQDVQINIDKLNKV